MNELCEKKMMESLVQVEEGFVEVANLWPRPRTERENEWSEAVASTARLAKPAETPMRWQDGYA